MFEIINFGCETYPVISGEGKRLFDNGFIPAAFTLTESAVTTKGVIMANYKRAGEVEVGTIGEWGK